MLMLNHLTGFGVGAAADAAPVGPADPYWTNVKLLIQPTAANVAAASYPTEATGRALSFQGSAALSSDAAFTGGGSIACNGGVTADYLTLADSADWRLSGDFALEFVAKTTTLTSPQVLMYQESASNSYQMLLFHVTDGLRLLVYNSGALVADVAQGGLTGWSANAYFHVAVTRSGSALAGYLNGQQILTATISAAFPDFSSTLRIGAQDATWGVWRGRIAAARLTNGVSRGLTGATIATPAALWPTY